MARAITAIIPHPDDELFVAGLLRRCADLGARVRVIAATRGEAGSSRNGDSRPLGDIRADELRRSCEVLGALAPVFLDLPDGHLAQTGDETRERIAAALAEETPQVAVTLGTDGVYGHTDHIAVTGAVSHWARSHSQVRVLHAAFPRATFSVLARRLARVPRIPIDHRIVAAGVGIDPERAQLHLGGADIETVKRAAASAHQSQLRAGDTDSFLVPGLMRSLVRGEWYTVASGPPLPPGAADAFAGLVEG